MIDITQLVGIHVRNSHYVRQLVIAFLRHFTFVDNDCIVQVTAFYQSGREKRLYFANKDELFCEVVRPVLYALEAMLQEHHGIRGEDVMMMRSEKYLKSCIDEYVSLMEKHRPLMEILLFRAQGSSLEHFRENYTDRSTELVKAWFTSMQRKHPEINTDVSDFIIHLHTVWMFTLFEELLMHSVPRPEMEAILHDYILFEIQGWRAIIRI